MHQDGTGTAPAIVGRASERSRLSRALADAKDGRGYALVLRGEAGIGKTSLLDHAAAIAGGFRVLRASGVESEAEIPFAALHLLLAPFAERVDDLPAPQARALRAAFGTVAAPTEPLMVGAATLLLLSELADEAPVLCLLDDAHWFDRSSAAALLFAARRLRSDPVVVILAARDGDRPFPADGVESLTLPRFDDESAALLLAGLRTLPHDVAGRVIRESGGNPLAIVELAADRPKGVLPAPVAPLPAAGRMEEHFRGRLLALPERTRWALLLAAADDRSDLTAFAAAAERLGLGVADLEPAELQRLVRVTAGGLEFRHPLVRAAAYQDVPLARRLAAHQALAAVLDDARDADRRAWHLAAAATGADEIAAAALDRAAERALARGAPAAASRAWERAAALSGGTPEGRLVDAARAAYDAGELDRAQALATAADAPGLPAGQAAEAAWVRAQVAYERESPARACGLALEVAAPIVTTDPDRATAVLTEAAWCARDAASPVLLARCAELARELPAGRDEVRDCLIGVASLLRGEPAATTEPLRALLLATRDGRVEDNVERLLGGFAGLLIGADDVALEALTAQVAGLRDDGAIGWLPYVQETLALAHLVSGRFRDAEVTVTEAVALATELGQHLEVTVLTSIAAWLAAVRGDPPVVVGDTRGHRMAAATLAWADGVALLARAEPAAALDRLEDACTGPARFDVNVRAIPDHVEAAIRAGDRDRAGTWLPDLDRWAARTAGPAATALALRCAALLDDGAAAADRFEASLRAGAGPYDEARTRLAYGEWLRRHRRPTTARDQLTRALETFDRIAAHAWKPRARAELDALGGAVPQRRPEPRHTGRLTPQELQVVRLAARGLTNREIAGQLFLSPRTIGHHLYKAYPKLGVARRAELGRLDL
ncbi:ATP-binding protein [Jiangella alkaliphila]|uniref:Regulatory protein, luxR family n=1 Tax=Jiangella alkaliphila TaxID=419479 RepID=A0A1H2JKQ1_9ACTN|nr:helix-turn-helix transcriptional regulator [Jiangella alkaliphila]SDU56645.1 regulatory protein, luxR family [Jiangella alkaliphila]